MLCCWRVLVLLCCLRRGLRLACGRLRGARTLVCLPCVGMFFDVDYLYSAAVYSACNRTRVAPGLALGRPRASRVTVSCGYRTVRLPYGI